MVVNFRSKTFTRDDVERAMERFDREFRDGFRRWKTYSVKHNDRHYPPKELLRIIVGDIGNLSGAERAKLAATVVPGLTLKSYRVNFVFADA